MAFRLLSIGHPVQRPGRRAQETDRTTVFLKSAQFTAEALRPRAEERIAFHQNNGLPVDELEWSCKFGGWTIGGGEHDGVGRDQIGELLQLCVQADTIGGAIHPIVDLEEGDDGGEGEADPDWFPNPGNAQHEGNGHRDSEHQARAGIGEEPPHAIGLDGVVVQIVGEEQQRRNTQQQNQHLGRFPRLADEREHSEQRDPEQCR